MEGRDRRRPAPGPGPRPGPGPAGPDRAGCRAVSLLRDGQSGPTSPGRPSTRSCSGWRRPAAVVVAIAACWAQGELPGLAGRRLDRPDRGRATSSPTGGASQPAGRGSSWSWPLAVVRPSSGSSLTVRATATAGRHLDGRGPLAVLFSLDPGDPRLRRPGPARPRVLAGRVGHPDGRGRRPGGRHHLRPSTWWSGPRFGAHGLLAMWSSMAGGARCGPGRRGAPPRWPWWSWARPRRRAARPARRRAHLVFPSSLAGDVPVASRPGWSAGAPTATSRSTPPAYGRHPGRAGSSASPAPSTPPSGARSATRSSCGSAPTGRPSGWPRPSTVGRPELGRHARPRPGPAELAACSLRAPRSTSRRPTGEETGHRHRRRPDLLPGPGGPEPGLPRRQRQRVWFPSRRLFLTADGTIGPGTSMGPGSIYTVVSASTPRHRPSCSAAPPRRPSAGRQLSLGRDGPLPPAPPPLPGGGRPGPADHGRHPARPPTTRSWPSRRGSAPTPATPPTSRRWRRARTPSTSSSSATAGATASRSPRRSP